MVVCTLLLAVGCGNGSTQEVIRGLGGEIVCSDATGTPMWDFQWTAQGPASDVGSVVYVETPTTPNPDGYALNLDGRQGDTFVEWSTTVPGTAEGEVAAPGDVPFACTAQAGLVVTFCAEDVQTGEASCWVCGDEQDTLPERGADGWLDCS